MGLAVSALIILGSMPALAHSIEQSYVYLEIFDKGIEGRIEYPRADLAEVLNIEIPADPELAAHAVESNLGLIHDYSESHFSMGPGSQDWPVTFEGFEIFVEGPLFYVVVPFVVDRELDPMPRTFEVTYAGIIAEKPEKSALLLIATDWRSGTFNNIDQPLVAFDSENLTQSVQLGETSWAKALIGVIALGMEHIQIGSDHILFILALLLPAVLIFFPRHGWLPTHTFGQGLWRVVKIATSFTIAHTITLTLGGLGVIELSPRLVEPVIALSIALAALHNIRPVFFNKEWLLAFGFGLFHGFGFAGLLADLGLDRSNRVVSLLGFNLGIEIGQVVIILLVFPALYLLRRVRSYVNLMQVGSFALIVVAMAWFVERVFELNTVITRLVDQVLQWPRPLYLAATLTALALAYYWVENRRDRLIPVSDVADTATASPMNSARSVDR